MARNPGSSKQKTFQFMGDPSLEGAPASSSEPTPASLPSREMAYHAPTPRSLSLAETSTDSIEAIRRFLSLGGGEADTLLATIMAARGFSPDQNLRDFLEPDKAPLPDPSRMMNFDRAVEEIEVAIRSRHTIGLVGDYDVDGITSMAQIVNGLDATNTSHVWHIPNRVIDGYGISDRHVQDFIKQGVQLVILFDHGTHAIKQVNDLRAAGIKVVIFDHHHVGDIRPDAILVNPAQPGCGFAEFRPCASGLAFFLTHRLSEIFSTSKPDCGLAALGTIADMVPLRGPNRSIARQGISALRVGSSRGIAHLASQLGIAYSDITSSDIGFYIGPALNAAGRLDDARRCVELLTSDNEDRLRQIASELVGLTEQRKSVQRGQLQHNLARLGGLASIPPVLVSSHPDHHQGVVGLTAQGLALRYTRPTFVFAAAENSPLKGSARAGDPRCDLMALLSAAQRLDKSGLFLKVGGHPAAAGLTIREDGISTFTTLINRAYTELYGSPPSSFELRADAQMTLRSLGPQLVAQVYERLDPFGQGFEAPRIMFEGVRVNDIQEYAGGRRMVALEQANKIVRAFIGPETWNDDLRIGTVCNIIATPATIYRRERNHVQLSIHGYTIEAHPYGTQPESSGVSAGTEPPASTLPIVGRPRVLRPRVDGPVARTERLSQRARLQTVAERARVSLPRAWLYSELSQIAAVPGANTESILSQQRAQFMENYGLSKLKPDSFQFRPEQIEFCRYFLDRTDNVILQAPTGTGKTEMALIVASRQRSLEHRTIFAAPTIEIARQVSQRSPTMIDLHATLLHGEVTPQERAAIYRTKDPHFISAVPHVLKNDIDAGSFSFRSSDLLIVDEGHHATGEYPYVPLVTAARSAGARVLLLSATPGQVEPGGSWVKLETLKSTIGAESIFPLNVVPRTIPVSPMYCELTGELKGAISHLADRLTRFRSEILEYLEGVGADDTLAQARRHFGGGTLTFPSSHAIEPIVTSVRTLNDDPDRWRVVSALYAAGETSELYQLLAYQGISGFLLRMLEKRFEIAFPTTPARVRGAGRSVAAPQYLRDVYCSRDIERAYNHLARGGFVGLLTARRLAEISGIAASGWNDLSGRERRSRFNQNIGPVLDRLRQELVELDYSDHPKEAAIFKRVIEMHPSEQSAIYTRDRSHAMFLTARLSHRLGALNKTAVALTGLGAGTHRGVSRHEREENVARFLRGEALVIVSTSAGNEGIDFPRIQHGYAYRFNGSFIEAMQQWGRIGRRGLPGSFHYLCSTPEEYGRVDTIHRKERLFYEKMNMERQALLDASTSGSAKG